MQRGRLAAFPLVRKFYFASVVLVDSVPRATAVLLGGQKVGSEPISPYPWLGRRR